MSGKILDLSSLTAALNAADIRDAKGNKIDFQGEYINTHLQKGGRECMRFSTLYAYQIAKKRSRTLYQEVNGAFAAGKLHTLTDLDQIDGSIPLKDASNVPTQNYKTFMNHWAFAVLG